MQIERKALNKIIAKTMRRIQLTHGAVRVHLQQALRLLNDGRKALSQGYERACRTALELAHQSIQLARIVAVSDKL